jgi:CRISPR system Cascade subunit CasE
MYLSKLVLNGRDRTVLRDLSNAHALHQRIMQAFPDEQRTNPRADWNILYRHEPDSDVILVQSDLEPDWESFPEGYLIQHPSKPVNLTASQLAAGRLFQFRLKANPSKRDKQTRKTIGMFRQTDQLAWLERQASQHGFTISNVDIVPTPNIFGVKAKGTSPIRIQTAIFQGVLQITQPEPFIQAMHQGIGRGRSYGCGLLSISRLT